jgi:molecular chaperone DnaK (HSP70)
MTFDIYEGERLEAKKNHFLGVLEISDLTPAPPGECTIEVTMSIDQNGILKVSARETVSNKTKDLKIVYTRGSRSDGEIKNTLVDATENKQEDQRFSKFAELKGYVIKYCVRSMYNFEDKNLLAKYRAAYDKCADVCKNVKNLHVDDEKEVIRLKKEICSLIGPIEKEYKFAHMP